MSLLYREYVAIVTIRGGFTIYRQQRPKFFKVRYDQQRSIAVKMRIRQ